MKAAVTPAESKQAAGGLSVAFNFHCDFRVLENWFTNTSFDSLFEYQLGDFEFVTTSVLMADILLALWEAITRRKVHPKVVNTLVNVFAILLIGAMLLLTFRDAERQWKITNLFKKAPAAEQVENPPTE